MRIVLQSLTPAIDLAERLAKRFELPVPHAREWAAKILGYQRWETLREEFNRLGVRADLSAPDRLCAPLAIRWRLAYQAERLVELAGINLSDAARLIEEAGYAVSFMTNSAPVRPGTDLLHLQRTNIEARDPDWLVRFQLSGLLDVLYTAKRRRVDRVTRRPPT